MIRRLALTSVVALPSAIAVAEDKPLFTLKTSPAVAR